MHTKPRRVKPGWFHVLLLVSLRLCCPFFFREQRRQRFVPFHVGCRRFGQIWKQKEVWWMFLNASFDLLSSGPCQPFRFHIALRVRCLFICFFPFCGQGLSVLPLPVLEAGRRCHLHAIQLLGGPEGKPAESRSSLPERSKVGIGFPNLDFPRLNARSDADSQGSQH